MENVIANLALSGANMIGKAAFSFAASMAVKKISSFVESASKSQRKHHVMLSDLYNHLSQLISILSPTIETIQFLAARGDVSLEPLILKISQFQEKLSALANQMELCTGEFTQPLKGQGADEEEQLIQLLKDRIHDVEVLIPLLQIGLTTATMSIYGSGRRMMDPSGSPYLSYSRLIQASSALVAADVEKRLGNSHNTDIHHLRRSPRRSGKSVVSSDPSSTIVVGNPFCIRLYTLFEGSAARGKSSFDGKIWREDYAKACVTMQRHVSTLDGDREFKYSLKIVEDLNDGRVHDTLSDEDQDRLAKKDGKGLFAGRSRTIDVTHIQKIYYTQSGTLLRIEDATLPVIVLKIVSGDSSPTTASASGDGTPLHTKTKVEWIALELYGIGDTNDSGSETSIQSDSEAEDEAEQTDEKEKDRPNSELATPAKDSKDIHSLSDRMSSLTISRVPYSNQSYYPPEKMELGSLCYLDYMLRLSALEVQEQKSHTVLSDATLLMFLASEGPQVSASGLDMSLAAPIPSTRQTPSTTLAQERVPFSANRMDPAASALGSPLALRGRERLIDRLRSETF